MPVTDLRPLSKRLNPACAKALNEALGLCVARTNPHLEIEHWLFTLAEPADGDLARIFRQYDVDVGRVKRDLGKAIDQFKTGSSRTPGLSTDLGDLMLEAWTLTSLTYEAPKIRSGYVLAALLSDRRFNPIRTAVPELSKVRPDELIDPKRMAQFVSGTAEDQPTVADTGPDGRPAAAGSATPSLDQFTYDLTARAKKGELDAVIGREFEIRQVIDILTRRRQNNPILTGEAGVGKTAVVEGFALKVVAGDVPPPLKNVQVHILDLSLLQAGAGVKGEFENRLKGVIQEVKASPIPIILFIDEAHTLIGAGGAAGQGDAANLLKPALARGELRTIAATTWMEYKKYFEADAALKRRFQVVKVAEPEVDLAVKMMRGLVGMLEKHHKVRILDEAVTDAVKLSHRYISDRQLPDKCVSLLDTACAKVALSQTAVPATLEDVDREIHHYDVEIGILEREQAAGGGHEQRLAELKEKKADAENRLKDLDARLQKERALVEEIRALRGKLEAHAASRVADSRSESAPASSGTTTGAPAPARGASGPPASDRLSPADEEKAKAELAAKSAALAELQGEHPLVQPFVTGQAVAEIVSGWTGIPIGKMVRNEIDAVLKMKDRLAERVVGQDHALEAIAQRIQTARANLADPRRPLGVFFLVGPSGVGKTETAIALAELLYGGDRNMITINMSEFKEEYKVSQLLGSPIGYQGSDQGGVLTEAVRRKPYSVVLLDEVEKSHPSVQEIFYQVFDKGTLTDSRGIEVNFKNTIILLTSNVGTDTIMKVCADPDTTPDPNGLATALREDLLKAFKPALLGRMTIVPYYPLGDQVLKSIIRLKLKQIGDRVRENYRAAFGYDDAVVETVAGRCKEVETGARNVDHILTGTMLPELAREFLARMADGRTVSQVRIGVGDGGQFTYQID